MVRLNGAAFTQRKLGFCSGWAGWGKRFIPDWALTILFTSKAADMLGYCPSPEWQTGAREGFPMG